jgi:elongation factor Ts
MSTTEIGAKDVKALRERTGAGMMDCKKALTEAGGDIDKAIEILRLKQGKKIQDLGERTATEGTVQSYIHAGARVGVLIEVDCNTDFVANNEDFVDFARDVALQIAATPTVKYVSREDVPAELRDAEARIYEQEAAEKPRKSSPASSTRGTRRSCCSSRRCTTRSSTARPSSSCATS